MERINGIKKEIQFMEKKKMITLVGQGHQYQIMVKRLLLELYTEELIDEVLQVSISILIVLINGKG